MLLTKLQNLANRLGPAEDASKRTGVEAPLLRSLAAGSLEGWTTAMVERLARTAGLDPAVVWGPEPIPEVPTIRFLRGQWPDFNDADVPVLMAALEQGCALRSLARVLERPLRFDDAARVGVRGKAFEHGYRLAATVRKAVGNMVQPIHVEDLAVDLQVQVVHRPLKTVRLEAVTLMSAGGVAVVVNARPKRRQVLVRRAIAHELSHALFDPRRDDLSLVLEHPLDVVTDDSPEEQRARAFAAELLVPFAGLNVELGASARTSNLDVAADWVSRLAAHFRAPSELVANHLVNRGFVDDALRERLIDSVRGEEAVPAESPRDGLQEAVLEAIGRDLISAMRGRELLGRSVYDDDLAS